ncbi:unnamed protein product [Symbiodinium microadriaticum]|nr:unnamed protein product [Symbiodinium microadriaticum]
MLGRVLSQSVQSSPDTSCILQFSTAHQNLDSSDPDCSSSADWTEQLRVTALNSTVGRLTRISTSSGAEGDTSLMAWSPDSGTVPGDVLVFGYSASAGWEVQANLTEVASQNVTLRFSWAELTALSSEKIVVAAQNVVEMSTHTFKYDGASWVFLGQQSFPFFSFLLALGGDLLVLHASGLVFQTFQLQGSSWSLVPTADIHLGSTNFQLASDGRTLAIQGMELDSPLFVYRWAGDSWSNVANFSATGFGVGVDVDGGYIIASWVIIADTRGLETAIYEDQGGLWSEVFRIDSDPRVQFARVLGISSSGKAIVDCASAVGCSGITILEVSSNGTWGVTQTIDYVQSASERLPSGAISAISLVVAEWIMPDLWMQWDFLDLDNDHAFAVSVEVMEGDKKGTGDISIPHTPTSIAPEIDEDGEDMELEQPDVPAGGEGPGKRRRPALGSQGGSDDLDGSPSKRGHDCSGVVTSRELRLLLGQHMKEMKEAWGVVESRVAAVEKATKGHDKELKAVHTKHKNLENKVQGIQAKGDATGRRTDELEGRVTKLETQIEELASRPVAPGSMNDGVNVGDPWADYLNQKNKQGDSVGNRRTENKEEAKGLSEEDQRTLIVGGWLPDTRRAKIEEEAKAILDREDLQNLIDADKLLVFGPRRSFGMLRFHLRQGEMMPDLKKRMWEVVSKIRGGKIVLDSTRGEHGSGGKVAWASFLKTPEARRRSALCSLTRRIAMQLASIGGEIRNEAALVPESYDVDWGTGTIWNGELKLASATHRKDNNRGDDFYVLPQGWVDLRAITSLTGVAWEEAVRGALFFKSHLGTIWNLGGQPVDKDISALARTCAKPFPSMGYRDPDVVWDAIRPSSQPASEWDVKLDALVNQVQVEEDWKIAETEPLSGDLVAIINHVVQHAAVPESWNKSLLALLAKVDVPTGPQDLRPIAMSSAIQKLVSRLVMMRTFPLLRGGTDICCSGKNRQAADLVGCLTHLRDVVKEWRLPMLITKLDIRGAFDSLGRHALASYLLRKLQHCAVGRELRYLLLQLRPNVLSGRVPGGEMLELCCTTGIRQGSPESAELFALVLQDALEDMMNGKAWKSLGVTIPELNVELLMYQDDLFLWDDDAGRLTKRLELINNCLSALGLQLAAKKTAITSSNDYVGARHILFLGNQINIQSPSQPIRVLGLNFTFDGDSTRQARELIARLRAAFWEHRELLCGRASCDNKVFAVKRLVLSAISWVAGAVFWGPQDLATLNTFQMHVMRDIFLLRRCQGETWVDYNQRTMRFVRAWMHTNGCARWSATVRELQFGIAGHWCRQTEANNAFPLQRVDFVTLGTLLENPAFRDLLLPLHFALGHGPGCLPSTHVEGDFPGAVAGQWSLLWRRWGTFNMPLDPFYLAGLVDGVVYALFVVLALGLFGYDFFDFDLHDDPYEHFHLLDLNDFTEHIDLFDLRDPVDALRHPDLLDLNDLLVFNDLVDLDVLNHNLANNLALHDDTPYVGAYVDEFSAPWVSLCMEYIGYGRMKMDAHRPLPPVGDIRGHGTGVREGSTTSTTTPDGPGAEGEIGDYSPDATGEELETLSLQELVDQELCGGANQSGQLLMALDQHPSEFAVVNEPPPNRPTTVDWTHDVLHNLAQRVLYDTIGAQRYGHPPTVRWGAHIAAAEFRDVGRMFTRLGDMIVNSIDRPVDEPRTAPPTNEPMYRHYREWSKRWREMFLGVIREFLQHTDAEVVEHQARLRARDDHYRRMAELRDLERYRTLQRSGPEPGLGVPVARRPSGAMGGKRSHEQMTAKGGDRGRSSTDTFPGRSPLDVVPPRPKFRMPTPSPSEEIRGGRPVQTPDPRLPTPGSILGVGLASSSSWPQGWDDRAGLQEGATVAWDGPITSLTSTASSSVGRGAHVMPTTPIMPPPDNATTPRPTPLVPDQRPPVAHSDSFGVTRSSIWDQHNNPGTPTIPPVPIITAVTPVTPFDERGHPIITPIIPSAPVITSTTPMTPFPEDVPEVDEVIQEICGPLSSSSTTTTGVPGIGLPFSTSSTTTPHGADEEVDYDEPDDEQDEHIPSDEVEVTVEEDGAVTMDGYVTMTGERGMGEDDLSPREERLDRHVAGMVVAEVYHLLRTTGVIASIFLAEPFDFYDLYAFVAFYVLVGYCVFVFGFGVGFAMWSLGAWCMLGRVLSQSVQSSPDTSCMLQFSAAHQNLDSSDPDCSSSADWTEQLRVTALNFTSSSLSGISTSSGAEGDTSLMAWSPNSGTIPGDVLVFKYSASAGWEVQANLTEVASQNVTLRALWADDTALSSEKIVVASENNVAGGRETHTFKYDGASWVFLGQQSFPFNSVDLALGGDLLVFSVAQTSGSVFQTFQLQGSLWSLVPTAEIQLVSNAIPRYASDGRTLAIQLDSQVFVYRWAGNSWSNVANISEPAGFGLGPVTVDVDGDYIIAVWVIIADTPRLETAIYEDQSGLWSEVFRIDNDISGIPFTRVLGISSSGKVSSNGTWGVTQTIDYVQPSLSARAPSGAISATSLAVAEWIAAPVNRAQSLCEALASALSLTAVVLVELINRLSMFGLY